MRVVFFHRKARPGLNFSIENLFKQVRDALPPEVQWEVKEMKYFSNGLFKRLYISIEAFFYQKDINHITGDIHFIALFLRKCRTVLTIHDLGSLNHPNPVIRLILNFFWITLPVKRSAIITTVSTTTKNELLKHVKIDPERIKVIYNPVSSRFYSSKKEFNKQNPQILQIGTKHNKNIERLVEALAGIPCRLEIIGNVNEKIRFLLQKFNIEYNVAINLSDDEIVEKYKQADIVSFVSTFEGFGMPIVEANSIGRVVVTSNLSSMPEIAGDAACFVDPFEINSIRNGFIRVIEDDFYREKLIDYGFINARRFEAQAIANAYTSIYRDLLNCID